jgi:hypothetical protein
VKSDDLFYMSCWTVEEHAHDVLAVLHAQRFANELNILLLTLIPYNTLL